MGQATGMQQDDNFMQSYTLQATAKRCDDNLVQPNTSRLKVVGAHLLVPSSLVGGMTLKAVMLFPLHSGSDAAPH